MSTAESVDGAGFGPAASIQELRIARVYAEALLDAADQRSAVEEVKAELHELVEEVFRRQPEFEAFLRSGAIGKGPKEKVLRSVFETRSGELFFNTLMVLNQHERLDLLRPVYLVYNQLVDQRNRRIPVQITTAVPLAEEQTNRLLSFLHDSLKLEPILKTIIDPNILGGMMLRVGDWLFDGSIRSELENFRKQLMARSSHEIQSRRDQFSNTAGN
jgi:F-type H+-transporting ATPase subunit delta